MLRLRRAIPVLQLIPKPCVSLNISVHINLPISSTQFPWSDQPCSKKITDALRMEHPTTHSRRALKPPLHRVGLQHLVQPQQVLLVVSRVEAHVLPGSLTTLQQPSLPRDYFGSRPTAAAARFAQSVLLGTDPARGK